MSMWSERKEKLEEEKKKEELKKIGKHIRTLPPKEQETAKDALKKAGIDVNEAMHQSARNRYDPYW